MYIASSRIFFNLFRVALFALHSIDYLYLLKPFANFSKIGIKLPLLHIYLTHHVNIIISDEKLQY